MRLLVHDRHPERYLDLVEARFPEIEITLHERYEGLEQAVRESRPQVALSQKFAGVPYPRAALLDCPTLEWLHVMGAGVDHLVPWDRDRITITNSAGIQADVMAQYALAGLLALNFELPRYLRDQAAGRWLPQEVIDARGQTLLVLGLGNIGRAVARHARALGLEVIGVRASAAPVEGVSRVYAPEALHEALALADAVVVLVPLTEATRGLIDARAIAAMKPDAVLVNLARGGIVDEAALADALAEGRLRGAVLDVFATEPLPAESPLRRLANVVVTPHVSSVYRGWERAAVTLFCDNLARRLEGRDLVNVVDPGRGY